MSPEATREERRKVQEERRKIINVLGSAHCLKEALRSEEPPPDLDGAVELLEEELQRIINALDPVNLEQSEEVSETGEPQP